MEKNKSYMGVLIFILGALASLVLAVLSTWPDFEATFYGFARRASVPLPGLHCPILLNRNESGVVSIKVVNTTRQRLTPAVEADFSTPLTLISTLDFYDLAPGESTTRQWTIGPQNIDLGQFIFSQVLVYGTYPLPDRESTCGTFIIDLPIHGNVLVLLLLTFGLGGMAGSLNWLWKTQRENRSMLRALYPLTFLSVVIGAALIAGLVGWWLAALLLMVVVLVMILVIFNYLFF